MEAERGLLAGSIGTVMLVSAVVCLLAALPHCFSTGRRPGLRKRIELPLRHVDHLRRLTGCRAAHRAHSRCQHPGSLGAAGSRRTGVWVLAGPIPLTIESTIDSMDVIQLADR